ncbi:phosphoglucomutase 1 [Schizopora paradoxa]|uniref:Phosphoglucomutase 1 n=1 Tax=Schizopora paradoxa TaxID=27342 RepID=A0A0H2S519_9AGAM|nr:phosphoglucomutase 1 [Schizopora paradoxa]
MDATLKQLVDEWLRLDKNEETLAQVRSLLESENYQELDRIMRHRIEFGTAGLRGKMEAGWARMNDLTVTQASQGLCAYVEKTVHNAPQRGIVIGRDHRYHSEHWANLVAMVFLNKGFKVYLHPGLVHTPLVPFAVSYFKAACGVMITASHNPKQDNGYKVYWENAVQIIAPHDTGIAKEINHNLTPVSWDTGVVGHSNACIMVNSDVLDAYMDSILSASRLSDPGSDTRHLPESGQLTFANSSMHGVGHRFVELAFKSTGLKPVVPVKAQQEPDPDFPTLPFPNPEEKGALNLAVSEADAAGLNYVLAQDPDADRFCAAEKINGKWTLFTGDQLGAIFAGYCLENYKRSGKPLDKLAMVASAVSSKMIEAIAEKEGFHFEECLTGFKYIGNTAKRLESEGFEVPFGYEEAIGFMVGSAIRDKDGVSASVHFAKLANSLHEKGSTVSQYLQELYERYGVFETLNSYFVCNDPRIIDEIFARLRAFENDAEISQTSTLNKYPHAIGGLDITSVRDLTTGYDSSKPPLFKPDLPLSAGHMITFRASSTVKQVKITLTIRTSGTEPKIKYYLEGSGTDRVIIREVLQNVVEDLRGPWMEAEKHHLKMP